MFVVGCEDFTVSSVPAHCSVSAMVELGKSGDMIKAAVFYTGVNDKIWIVNYRVHQSTYLEEKSRTEAFPDLPADQQVNAAIAVMKGGGDNGRNVLLFTS